MTSHSVQAPGRLHYRLGRFGSSPPDGWPLQDSTYRLVSEGGHSLVAPAIGVTAARQAFPSQDLAYRVPERCMNLLLLRPLRYPVCDCVFTG